MQFTLDQFGEVLRVRDSAGLPYVIIGGQAVNYWATRFLPHEPELRAWQPFTSKDIDFRGGRDDVLRFADQLKLPARFPHKKMMTAFAGAVPWNIGEHKSSVEVIRQMPGMKPAEIEKLAVSHDFDGSPIRVSDPISLLICKLRLALQVDQSNRRDGDHARILLLCTRGFLRETLNGVEAGELPARGWLGAVERVLKLAESATGRKAARKLHFDWMQVLPDPEIGAGRNPLVVSFRKKRLLLWREKFNGCGAPKKS